MEGSLADSHAAAAGNLDPDPASASPTADHAHRKLPVVDLVAGTEAGRHRAGALARRPLDEDKQYGPAQRPKRGRIRA